MRYTLAIRVCSCTCVANSSTYHMSFNNKFVQISPVFLSGCSVYIILYIYIYIYDLYVASHVGGLPYIYACVTCFKSRYLAGLRKIPRIYIQYFIKGRLYGWDRKGGGNSSHSEILASPHLVPIKL